MTTSHKTLSLSINPLFLILVIGAVMSCLCSWTDTTPQPKVGIDPEILKLQEDVNQLSILVKELNDRYPAKK